MDALPWQPGWAAAQRQPEPNQAVSCHGVFLCGGGDGDGRWCAFCRHMNWVDQVLPRLEGEERPLECMQLPGDVLYVPSVRSHPRLILPLPFLLAAAVGSVDSAFPHLRSPDLNVTAAVSAEPSRSAPCGCRAGITRL